MRVTVIPADNIVILDGEAKKVTLPALPNVHAIQWDGTVGRIEKKRGDPEEFRDESRLQPFIDAWNTVQPPGPSLVYTLPKELLVDRMTNVELTQFIAERGKLTVRQQEKLSAITMLQSDSQLFDLIQTRLTALFGAARSAEIMARP